MHDAQRNTVRSTPEDRPDRAPARLRTVGARGRSRYRLVAFSSLVSLVLALLCALWDDTAAAVVSAAMVLTIAWGWPAASGAAARRGSKRLLVHTVVLGAAGLLAVLLVLFGSAATMLTWLPAIAAVGVVSVFIAELVRGEGADGRLESVITGATGLLASISASGWVGMAQVHEERGASLAVWLVGAAVALVLAVVGSRMVAAGPDDGPRRGAVTLGVVPVAFFGILGYAGASALASVLL